MFFSTGYVLIFVAVAFVGCFLPEIEFDPLIYHLTGPKLYLEAHRIFDVPEILELVWPKNIEMIYTFGLALHSQITVKFVNFFMGMLLLLAIYTLGRRFWSSQIGLLAAGLFVSVPVVVFQLRSIHIDVPIALFCFLSVYALVLWIQGMGRRWLILSAIFLGMAVGSKYNILFNVVAASAVVAYEFIVRRKIPLAKAALRVTIYLSISLCGLAPWLILTYKYTGDPFFPYLSGDLLFPFLRGFFPGERWELYNMSVVSSGMHRWGLPLSWTNVLKSLWEMHWDGMRFCGRLGPFFILLMPLLVFVSRLHPLLVAFLCYSGIYLVLWLVTTQANRYLIPVLPLFSIVCVNLLHGFLQAKNALERGLRGIIVGFLLLLAFYNLPFLFYLRQNAKPYFNPVLDTYARKFFVEPYDREKYLTHFLWSFSAINFVNSLPNVEKVLYIGFHDGPPLFYANFRTVYNELSVYNEFVQENDVARLLELIEQYNISHLIVEQPYGMGTMVASPESEFAHKHLRLLWNKNAVSVYEVSLEPIPEREYQVSVYLPEGMSEATIACKTSQPIHPPNTYLGVYALFTEPRFSIATFDQFEVRIPVRIPEDAALTFGLGVRRHTLTYGFVCDIVVKDSSSNYHVVFSRYLKPGERFDDRGWREEVVDLSPFAGQSVEIILTCKADASVQPTTFPLEIPDGMVLWSEPQIIQHRAQRIELTENWERFLILPASAKNWTFNHARGFVSSDKAHGLKTSKSLVVASGTEARYTTIIPSGAQLSFQVSLLDCHGQGAKAEILWERAGRVRTLYQKSLDPGCPPEPKEGPGRESVDLSELSGRRGTLIFRSSSLADKDESVQVGFHDLALGK